MAMFLWVSLVAGHMTGSGRLSAIIARALGTMLKIALERVIHQGVSFAPAPTSLRIVPTEILKSV